jgi:ATP-binding cassette subfamily F protein 3
MMDRFEKDFEYIKRMTLADPNAKGRFRRLTREVEAVQSHGIEAMRFVQKHGWMRYTQEYTRSNPPQTVEELERDLKALRSPVQHQRDMRLKLNADDRSGDNVLRTRRLAIGYERGEPLFTADDIDLMRGDVAALIGPNGAGKTTFLKTLMKDLQPLKGHVTYGASLQIGYFAQAHDSLDHRNSVLEELMSHRYSMTISEARHYLAPYLFTGEDVFKQVSELSGGERGRLALAVLSLKGANLLLLDEPTNHLDIPAQEVLQNVLERFDGTVILVSHDRYLIDRLGTQIWDLRDGHLRVFRGTYQDYLKTLEAERADEEAAARPAPEPDPEPAVDPKALSRLETQITSLENEISELETLLAHASAAGNSDTLKTLSKQYKARQEKLDELLQEWSLLAEQV